MLKKTPLLLLLLIFAALILEPFLPLTILRTLLAISLFLKSLIIFVLPLVIFGLLYSTLKKLAGDATRLILLVVAMVCLSNFTATFLSHFVGEWAYSFDLSILHPEQGKELQPLFSLEAPRWISNGMAMLLAILSGLILPKFYPKFAQKLSKQMDSLVAQLLKSILLIIPFFVFGFFLKLKYDGMILAIFKQYTLIFGIILLAEISYLFLMYFVGNGGNLKATFRSLKNMFPAMVCGFGTMSSAATMPYTILAAEKNTQNKAVSGSVIPATANIHLIGDCIAIPIFVYAILKSFGYPLPSTALYLVFVSQFVVAKFSVAAVPGGGMIVMLPIIERCFGFSAAMSSLIFSLYLLMDPFLTCFNVLGNGAFVQWIDRLLRLLTSKKSLRKNPLKSMENE